jgi:predicted dehydrogenase
VGASSGTDPISRFSGRTFNFFETFARSLGVGFAALVNRTLGVGVIGIGHAGARHARALANGAVEGARLAAVSDLDPARTEGFAAPSLPAAELAAAPGVDAVVVATPHLSHLELAELALGAGRHVLVEKPLGVEARECDRALRIHAELGPSRPLFGVVHDHRADPRFRWVASLLRRGELGRVERVVWQATTFFRTEAYYAESPWRGSFAREGGGLLVNQAPHLFDTLSWLFGMPRRVLGICRFGRFHEIEVEDDMTAHFEFASGMTALLVASTGESPGSSRLEISADRGQLVLEGDTATVHRTKESVRDFRRREASGRPRSEVEHVVFPPDERTAAPVLANFVQAIRGEARLFAPADQARNAVELANAVLWSSLREGPIDLPLDTAGFQRVQNELRQGGRRANSG